MEQHNEILPRLAAYHDGQSNAQERLDMQAHLEVCPACRTRLSEWRALDLALAALPVPEPAPEELHARALAALKAAGAGSTPVVSRPRQVRLWAAAVAAMLLFTAVSTWLWQIERTGTWIEAERPIGAATKAPAEPGTLQPLGRVDSSAPLQSGRANVEPSVASSRLETKEAETVLLEPTRSAFAIAPQPVGTGDSGIPQTSDWPARLFPPEAYTILEAIHSTDRLRLPSYTAPSEWVEINLVPLFEAAFVPVGYVPLPGGLNPAHEAAYSDPVQLTPETAYLVSNLRLEQTSLMARSHEEGPSADMALKLAEITWRLANLTADRDDVNSAIAAQHLALRHRPDLASATESRLVQLRVLGGN
jgi:hypothetical protein